MSTLFIVVLVLIVLAVVWGIGIYNKLIQLRNRVNNSWSQIDVQLQRRYDLIPNLVETVKEYMGYEKSTLEAVIQARNQAQAARKEVEKQGGPTASSLQELNVADTALKGGIAHIFALAENYPALRASENMAILQEELTGTENKVSFSRQAYNDSVLDYNTYLEQFPGNLFASVFGHHAADFFKVEEEKARKAPKVSF